MFYNHCGKELAVDKPIFCYHCGKGNYICLKLSDSSGNNH